MKNTKDSLLFDWIENMAKFTPGVTFMYVQRAHINPSYHTTGCQKCGAGEGVREKEPGRGPCTNLFEDVISRRKSEPNLHRSSGPKHKYKGCKVDWALLQPINGHNGLEGHILQPNGLPAAWCVIPP